eukprot:scaffold1866_cov277-Pinguiococcus_pyrenoidosus.AAC.8
MSQAGRNNVYYVGVARLADRVVVAQHSYNVKTDPDSVKTVLRQQMNMRPGTVYNFDVSGTTWHLTGGMLTGVFGVLRRPCGARVTERTDSPPARRRCGSGVHPHHAVAVSAAVRASVPGGVPADLCGQSRG